MPPKVWGQKICLIAKIIYAIILSTRSDHHQPCTKKTPLASCHTYSEMTTKHSCQKYTTDMCKTQQTRSWPQEIQCGSMIKMNHDECSHQTYIVDLKQDNDHSHDQVHCGSMMYYTQVSNIHSSNRSLGGEVITVKSPNIPGSSTPPNWYISSHVHKWSWCQTWGKSTD